MDGFFLIFLVSGRILPLRDVFSDRLLAKAQCGTVRKKLLKIGAQIKVSVRRIVVSFTSACPYAAVIRQAYHNIKNTSIFLVT